MDLQEYRTNRERFSPAELAKYHGQWVAFSLDGRRIIASNEDLASLDEFIVASGQNPEQVALEHIELDDYYLGAGELS